MTSSKRPSTEIVPSLPSSPASSFNMSLYPEPGEVPYDNTSAEDASPSADEMHANGVDTAQLELVEVKKITAQSVREYGREFAPVYERAANLRYDLEDLVNNLPPSHRNSPYLRELLKHAIFHNTRDEEDAPAINIVNDVDGEVIPPWEFHYSNKIWHGEGVPPPNVDDLYGCDCVGVCDPNSKTCACVRRYYEISKDKDYKLNGKVYDNDGHLVHFGWPIYECNDLCRCSDMCKNRASIFTSLCESLTSYHLLGSPVWPEV